MISVLIADDEYLIRSLIRNSVSWEALDMKVVAETGNGEDALDALRQLRPQVALVDINMPILNGLELARRIAEENLPTRVVFLTGYRNFEYAQAAVTCQAFDYLLKPVSSKALTDTLSRLAQDIHQEREHSSHVRNIENQNDKAHRILQERFIRHLVTGRTRMSAQQIESQMTQLGISLEAENLTALVVEVEQEGCDQDDGVCVYAVQNIFCELLEAHGVFRNPLGISEVDNFAIVLCNAAADSRQVREELCWCWTELTRNLSQNFPYPMTCGVCTGLSGYNEIPLAVREAMDATNKRFYAEQESLFFTDERAEPLSLTAPDIDIETLRLCIESGDSAAGRKMILSALRYLRRDKLPERFAKMTALGLVTILHSLAGKYNLSPALVQESGLSIHEAIIRSVSFQQMEEQLLRYYDALVAELNSVRKLSKIVFSAQEYIKQHFSEELSLKQIAAAAYAAPSYLSSLFKKEMGVSTTEYITICRMKQAAALMETCPEMSLVDISARVGYTDPYYFSRCFKRHYGVPPSKFLCSRGEWPPSGSGEKEEG